MRIEEALSAQVAGTNIIEMKIGGVVVWPLSGGYAEAYMLTTEDGNRIVTEDGLYNIDMKIYN